MLSKAISTREKKANIIKNHAETSHLQHTKCFVSQNCDVHLHAEIELLKNALADKHSQLLAMENVCLQESDRQVELEDSIIAWQDKYERLYESHKRVQKVNQNLEDKLLKLVDRNSGERAQLTSDVATLSVRLAQANYNIQSLKREIVSTVFFYFSKAFNCPWMVRSSWQS